jgi:hypothetical protein
LLKICYFEQFVEYASLGSHFLGPEHLSALQLALGA